MYFYGIIIILQTHLWEEGQVFPLHSDCKGCLEPISTQGTLLLCECAVGPSGGICPQLSPPSTASSAPHPTDHTTLLLFHFQLLPEAGEEILQGEKKKLLSVWSLYFYFFFAAKMEMLGLKKGRGRWKEQEQSPGSADHSTAHQQHEQWENKQRTDNSGTDGGRQDGDSLQQALQGAEAPKQAQPGGQSPGLCHRGCAGGTRGVLSCFTAQECNPSLQLHQHRDSTGRGHFSHSQCHLPPSSGAQSSWVTGEN